MLQWGERESKQWTVAGAIVHVGACCSAISVVGETTTTQRS